jgi:hypothetical protein
MASSGAAEVVIDVSSSLLLASPPMRLISALRLERAAFQALTGGDSPYDDLAALSDSC